MTTANRPLGGFGRKRLAACMAAALGLGGVATQAIAANDVVQVCSDGDVYSGFVHLHGLRSTVAGAAYGDTIDMSRLTNCTITLTAGEIPITVQNLTFVGPSDNSLTIDGNNSGRVFDHVGYSLNHVNPGVLTLSHMTITHGSTTGNGGCIQSVRGGLVDLFENVTVTGCAASGKGGGIAAPYVQTNQSTISNNSGGGIYAAGTRTSAPDAYLVNTTVSGNTNGAGLASNKVGNLNIKTSTISNNTSTTCAGIDARAGTPGYSTVALSYSNVVGNNAGQFGIGGICAGSVQLFQATVSGNAGTIGGVATSGNGTFYDFFVQYSTIANNTAYHNAGASNSYTAAFYASTISGNRSVYGTGGVIVNHGKFVNSTISGNRGNNWGGIDAITAKLYNTTIAFNASSSAGSNHAGGIAVNYCSPSTCNPSLSMVSTIVANNTSGALNTESDVYSPAGALTASSSLIMASSVPNTSITADPQLLPLANNGGTVLTHALGLHSPALGVGSNPKNLGFDERGSPFLRTWANGQTDIGAFQTSDEIFKNGFE